MEPVQSSNVAEIGWENDTLAVNYKSGTSIELPGVTKAQYEELMAAPSKGKALNGLIALRAGVTLKSCAPNSAASVAAGIPIHTTQADGCCGKALNRASLTGKLDNLEPFQCPRCGIEYRPAAKGPLVLWQAVCDVMVFKV